MSALQRFLGRDRKFFDLLAASAAEARAGTQRLITLIEQLARGGAEPQIVEIARKRAAHKQISNEITEALCKQFYTPLEREDIEGLSDALYKISKTVEKIAERLAISPSMKGLPTVQRQLSLLVRGAEVVEKMVTDLCAAGHGEQIKDEYAQLQAIEGEADRAISELLQMLYREETDARVIISWKDVYDLLEKAVDRCRDAGFVVFHVALKNA
ncbi:MAG: DUF47 family protein [Chthoniobacteraceae bacterium]